MKNMKMTMEEYQEMITYFEEGIKKVATKASHRDASYNYMVYSSYNSRYFPAKGGTVDFYLSGDSSIIFNNEYESETFFIASKNDVCTPSDISIVYENSNIIPAFPTHHSIIPMDVWNSPTAAPTDEIITTTIQVPYEVSSKRQDIFTFEVCDPGLYTFGDCDCSGDTYMYIFSSDYYDYSDDGCEGPNKCSKITYSYTSNTCEEFNLYVQSNFGEHLNGNLKLVGPNITDVQFSLSQIMCIGDISNACQLTCPDSKQDIFYINFAIWGNTTYDLSNQYPDPQCEDYSASAGFNTIANNDCINKHNCTISPNPGLVTTTCANSKLYIAAYCYKARNRRLEMEQATLKETIDDIDKMIQLSKINHSAEKLVPPPSSEEEKAEIILNRRLAEVTLSQHVAEEISKNRRTEERILNRRNLADSRSTKPIVKQTCYNDIDDEYVLKIEGYDQYGSIDYGEMFKDNGNSYSIYIYNLVKNNY
jgi:hypothetical protein